MLTSLPMQPSLALSALATPEIERSHRRRSGAYYTDFRLATYLSELLAPGLPPVPRVVDPASGTGILLAALTLAVCGNDRDRCTEFVGKSIHAADRSDLALHALVVSLAAMTRDLDALRSLRSHLRRGDSLLQGVALWADAVPAGFDAVIGNPPWEKLKLTRPEFVHTQDDTFHYGDVVRGIDYSQLAHQRLKLASYARRLDALYALQGSGEPDLYKPFLELALRLTRKGGQVGFLVPAGLVRSQGTTTLREHLFRRCSEVELTILENRARFFAIDSRFKFLALRARVDGGGHRSLVLRHAVGNATGVTVFAEAHPDVDWLARIRSDLTVPEVRGDEEWELFKRISENARPFAACAADWGAELERELDMTRDRSSFRTRHRRDELPVVEGRMIHQYRFPAKRYVSGTGRKAAWAIEPLLAREPRPQFWVRTTALRPDVLDRTRAERVGFCDITGQTNERALLAAAVPAGVVCGNKVPTILFRKEPAALYLWLAVANSIPFDWVLRRVVTTTVNYFILLSLPFPAVSVTGPDGYRLAKVARELTHARRSGSAALDLWSIAELRAEIDVAVLAAYRLGVSDLVLMLRDFPLLDRGQPALPGEARSTITRDLLLMRAYERLEPHSTGARERVAARVGAARALGALPYVPSEFAGIAAPQMGREVAVV
jgi:hypothetical protein